MVNEDFEARIEVLELQVQTMLDQIEPVLDVLQSMRAEKEKKVEAARKPQIPARAITIAGNKYFFRKPTFTVILDGELATIHAEQVVNAPDTCARILKDYPHLFRLYEQPQEEPAEEEEKEEAKSGGTAQKTATRKKPTAKS